MTKLMTKQEIKDEAQYHLLNDGSGSFIFVNENNIEPLETWKKLGEEIDENELANHKAVYAEMEKQFDRMKKFFNWETFQGSH